MMATWKQFDESMWVLLADAPLAAGAAVALASEGGGRREANAMITGWREAAREFGRNALISELAARMDPEEREQQGGDRNYGPPPSYDTLLDEALDLCEQAMALLAARAGAEDMDAYRGFVLHICERVATANNEQGILDFGGDGKSRDERGTLRLIARALGYGRA